MAKKSKKGKAPKHPCPQCGGKLIKIRNQEERQCKECSHREPISQSPGENKGQPIPEAQSSGKKLTEAPVASQSQASGDTSDKDWIGDFQKGIINDPPRPAERAKTPAQLEAEHVANLKRKPTPGDHISRGLLQHTRVQVHCWSIGPGRGYRYGTRCPYPSPEWSKEVTGAEAFQFLTKIKRANRLNKLESGRIILFD